MTLRFRPDRSFTIVQFTDLHWHNGDPDDRRTAALMERVLDCERPDLVVLTGDVLEGKRCRDPAAAWRAAVAPMEVRAIPWAAVFGNHDDEGPLSRHELMAVQRTCRHCLSEPGPESISGVGNYVLRLRASASDEVAAALYCLDSGSYAPEGLGRYGWIRRDQIAWYLAEAEALDREWQARRAHRPQLPERIPALAFFHIPLPEYNEVWDFHPCRGHKYEAVYCPVINTGFFAAMVEAGDVLATFVGHDHINDFEGNLYGIRLCYGRGSGYNTYGRDGFLRGARVIRLREEVRDLETWHRLEDGTALTDPPRREPLGPKWRALD